MAPGVGKTYKKLYRYNFIKTLELLIDGFNQEDDIRNVFEEIERKYKLIPSMANNEEYLKIELEYTLQIIDDEDLIKKVQKFVLKNTLKETNRKTYQAMEALIHNLNTMHSRAGAQIPFSSINYGTDLSPEGRMVMKNLLLATEAGLGNGETPIFPIQIFKLKEGINYNSKDPNYDLFKLACRVSAKRLFPNFSFIDAPYNLQYYKPGHPETEIAYMGCRSALRCA